MLLRRAAVHFQHPTLNGGVKPARKDGFGRRLTGEVVGTNGGLPMRKWKPDWGLLVIGFLLGMAIAQMATH